MKRRHLVRFTATVLSLSLLFASVAGAITSSTLMQDRDNNYLKYIAGFEDGTIRPDATLTRAQGAKMLSYVLDTDAVTGNNKSFTDVPKSFWGYDAITTLSSAGIIGGYAGDVFKPNQGLTRAEFCTILARIIKPEASTSANDLTDLKGHWAEADIRALSELKYIGGYADKTFKPNKFLTRAEAVKLINRAVGINPENLKKLNAEDKDFHVAEFSDLPTSHWAYWELCAAASTTKLESTVERKTIKFDDITYIDMNANAITERANTLLNEFPKADTKRQVEIYKALTKLEDDFYLAYSMTSINQARDTSNIKYKTDMSNSTEARNAVLKAMEKRYELVQKIKYKPEFEKNAGIVISNLEEPTSAMSDERVALYTEQQNYINEFEEFYFNNSIDYKGSKYSLSQAEYSSDKELVKIALDYYNKNYKELGTIFGKLVDVRTRIAKSYGFKNYAEIGYPASGKFTYSPESIEPLRKEIKTYIVPLFNKIRLARNGLSNGYKKIDMSIVNKDLKNPLESTQDILRRLSPQTRQAFNHMKKYNMFDLESRENKNTGAFTAYIDYYDTPFILMNKNDTIDDIETFSHEFGHAFQEFRIMKEPYFDSNLLTYDLAEIASYGMQVLTSRNYNELLGKNAEMAELDMLYGYLSILLSTTFLDEFQYIIYSNPNMTIEDRNATYAKLEKQYFPGDISSHPALMNGIVWNNSPHIFETPFYAIDYTMALTTALQIWQISKVDFDTAFTTYMDIIESKYMKYGFEAVVTYSGLESPFKGGFCKSLAKDLDDLFRKSSLDTKAS